MNEKATSLTGGFVCLIMDYYIVDLSVEHAEVRTYCCRAEPIKVADMLEKDY